MIPSSSSIQRKRPYADTQPPAELGDAKRTATLVAEAAAAIKMSHGHLDNVNSGITGAAMNYCKGQIDRHSFLTALSSFQRFVTNLGTDLDTVSSAVQTGQLSLDEQEAKGLVDCREAYKHLTGRLVAIQALVK